MVKRKTVNVNVRVSPELHEFLVAEAERDRMTISTWIRRALGKLHDAVRAALAPAWQGASDGKAKRGKSAR